MTPDLAISIVALIVSLNAAIYSTWALHRGGPPGPPGPVGIPGEPGKDGKCDCG